MVHLTQQILTQLSPPPPKYTSVITYTYPKAMVHLTQQILDPARSVHPRHTSVIKFPTLP